MANDNEESVFTNPEMTQAEPTTGSKVGQKNPRARMIMIIMGVLMLIVLLFAIAGLFGKGSKSGDTGAVPAAPNVNNIPGGTSSPVYDEMVEKENQQRAEDMGTSLPILTNPDQPAAIDPFLQQPVAPPVTEPEVIVPPEVVQLPPEPIQQPVQPPQPVYQPPVEQGPRYSDQEYMNMASALQAYVEVWKVPPAPAQEFSFNGEEPQVDDGSSGQGSDGIAASVSGGTIGGGGSNVGGSSGPSFVRAGTVIPAMLLSTINSDNPGPILAQITSGPLAGTRLVGEFSSTGKAVVLSFATMSKPGLGTFSVDVVAVDDKYGVGMQTDVNNHYFRRYGLLLAASFLEGYGQAAGRANTVITTGPFGSTVTQGELSSEQIRNVAYGKVGSAVAQNLLTESDVPPTVKLDCDGGCPIGLLFLSDL